MLGNQDDGLEQELLLPTAGPRAPTASLKRGRGPESASDHLVTLLAGSQDSEAQILV